MPYKHVADKVARSSRQYQNKKGYFASKYQRWKAANPKRCAFLGQRHTSKQRGVEFNLSFEEWCDFWGADFIFRGIKNDDLQMCRYGDEGPYEIGNIYKDTKENNKLGPKTKEEIHCG